MSRNDKSPLDNLLTVEEQKELLRLKLQAQRQELIRELSPPPPPPPATYPRSMTMRFLTEKRGAKWVAGAAATLLGRKGFRRVSTALLVSRMVSSMLAEQKKKHSADDETVPPRPPGTPPSDLP